MSNHTRVDIEATDDYECAFGDCGHEVRPCPTSTWDCCRECTDRSWDQYEGGVVTWDECKGVGASFAEQELDDACLDEFDLPTRSADLVQGDAKLRGNSGDADDTENHNEQEQR